MTALVLYKVKQLKLTMIPTESLGFGAQSLRSFAPASELKFARSSLFSEKIILHCRLSPTAKRSRT